MKIVFITPNLANGGAERVTAVLASCMAEQGHDVTLAYMKDDAAVYPLNSKVQVETLFDRKKSRLSVMRKILRLRERMRKERDAAYIAMLPHETYYTYLASRGIGCRVIYSLRNDPEHLNGMIHTLNNRFSYPSASRIVFQTEEARDYYPEHVRAKGRVIVNPVSDTLPDPYTGERVKEFVGVGRLNQQKNFPLLLRAFSDVHPKQPEWKLKIYGQGPLEAELKAMAEELGLGSAVEFCGFVNNISERIRESGCFVLSSDYEGISNAMLEALAIGLPCICTDCPAGGARLLIRHGENGILLPVGDREKLAAAMLKIIEEPEYAKQLSEAAAVCCREYTPDRIARQWIDTICEN